MKSIKLTWRFSGGRARDAGGAADAVVVDAGSASPCAASGAASGGASGSASGAAAGALSTAEPDGRLDGPDHADDPSESVAVWCSRSYTAWSSAHIIWTES